MEQPLPLRQRLSRQRSPCLEPRQQRLCRQQSPHLEPRQPRLCQQHLPLVRPLLNLNLKLVRPSNRSLLLLPMVQLRPLEPLRLKLRQLQQSRLSVPLLPKLRRPMIRLQLPFRTQPQSILPQRPWLRSRLRQHRVLSSGSRRIPSSSFSVRSLVWTRR